jgi:hypothetical protein
MANYRQIHVSIWKDGWFLDLEPDEKLLFIYLFSNESASLSGLYKLPLKVICFETCLDRQFVTEALAKFEQAGKVFYRDGVLWVKKMREYNRGGETVYKRMMQDIDQIPDCELKTLYLRHYPKPVKNEIADTLSVDYPYPTDTQDDNLVKCNEMKCNEMNLNTIAADAAPVIPELIPPKPARKPPPEQPEREELIKYFLVKTGLTAPRGNTQREIKSRNTLWYSPAKEILELSNKDPVVWRFLIDQSLDRLKGMTVADLNSVIKTIRSVSSENHRPTNGANNGYTHA